MADISAFLEQIRKAPRGETVRDAIINAIKEMGTKGVTAKTLNKQNADFYASYEACTKAFITGKLDGKNVYDQKLTKNSTKTPDGNALYDEFKIIHEAFNKVLGIEETWP